MNYKWIFWIFLLFSISIVIMFVIFIYLSNCPLNNSKSSTTIKPPVYAMMTTLPERITSDYFKSVVENIAKQPIDHIILNIPDVCKRTKTPYVIPPWITTHPKIIVNRCQDIGPLTKVKGGLNIIPSHSLVIVLDDDIIYQDFTIQGLIDAFWKKQDQVTCWNSGQLPDWIKDGYDFRIPGGYSGCIASGSNLKKLETLESPSECFFIDDDWLGWAYHKLGIKVGSIDDNLHWAHSCKGLYDHPKWFELRLNTNRKLLQQNCKKALKKLDFLK